MSTLMTALSGTRPETLPVWFMRQAGRSLPEYRQVRGDVPMLDSCLIPEMAAEITLQPVRRHGVDAAIFFSDIMIPLRLAGVDVEIKSSVGPVFDRQYQDASAVAELVAHRIEDAHVISQAVQIVVDELGEVPLLGFAGAPFTLAAYLVQGQPSRDHLAARRLMHSDPRTWDQLMSWCAEVSRAFLEVQIAAGASAVQLFDSWAGSLRVDDYVRYVRPYSKRVLDGLDVPTIHFGTNTRHLLGAISELGTDAYGIDYRTSLDEAVHELGGDVVVQGNIDPAMLGAPPKILEDHVRSVVAAGRSARAHIVNLGHGVPPDTDPDVLTRLVELVHSL